MMWEVFDPRDGRAIVTTRSRLLARILSRLIRRLDYERTGQGW